MGRRFVRIGAATVAVTMLAVGALASPAASEDSTPPRPGQNEYSCANPIGGLPDSNSGTIVEFPPGVPAPVPGLSGKYICLFGRWVWMGPLGPTGPVFMVGAPELTIDEATVVVDEGSTASNSGFVGDGGGDPVVMGASIGTVTTDGAGNWSWSYDTTDGPSQAQQVLIIADAAGRTHTEVFDLTVENVAPTVVSLTPSSGAVLVGQPVTFHASATDPSEPDVTAGFDWSFDGGPASPSDEVTITYDSCGTYTVSVAATDKDGSTGPSVVSSPVTVFDAHIGAPLVPGAYNAVRAGQVVPIRLDVGCGTSIDGLAPRITVLSGDVDPATATDDPTLTVPIASANGADDSGVMRATGGGYLYDLRVPTGPAGTLYTVRVRPFEGSNASLSIVLKIRK